MNIKSACRATSQSLKRSSLMTRLLSLIALLLIMIGSTCPTYSHDSWVSKGGLKNGAGEWCCGDYDCHTYDKTETTASGWRVNNKGINKSGWANAPETELIPYDDAMPLAPPDGKLAVCRRPDGTRRCVFGLKPGI